MIPFAGNPLDRASAKRTDADWVAARRGDASSFILPMWRLQPFIIGPEKAPAPVELDGADGVAEAAGTDGAVAPGLVVPEVEEPVVPACPGSDWLR